MFDDVLVLAPGTTIGVRLERGTLSFCFNSGKWVAAVELPAGILYRPLVALGYKHDAVEIVSDAQNQEPDERPFSP